MVIVLTWGKTIVMGGGGVGNKTDNYPKGSGK